MSDITYFVFDYTDCDAKRCVGLTTESSPPVVGDFVSVNSGLYKVVSVIRHLYNSTSSSVSVEEERAHRNQKITYSATVVRCVNILNGLYSQQFASDLAKDQASIAQNGLASFDQYTQTYGFSPQLG